ncbi:MAG: hypothetical protein KGI04_00230 [Candidatus Micrarchaeota archaeon]|nr:hypothetical protein [Candidatus Micrarchaeota archaeon]
MKAQFATIEAGLAFVLIVSAVTLASSWVNSATANMDAQEASLRNSIALYDIVRAIGQNATYAECVLQQGCLPAMEQNLTEIFGTGSISVGPYETQSGICAQARAANQTLYVCVPG